MPASLNTHTRRRGGVQCGCWQRTTTVSAAPKATSRSSASAAFATVFGRAVRPFATRLAASSGAWLGGVRRVKGPLRLKTKGVVCTRTVGRSRRPLSLRTRPGLPDPRPTRSRSRPVPPWLQPRLRERETVKAVAQGKHSAVSTSATWGAPDQVDTHIYGECAPKSHSGCVVAS